MKAIGVFDSGVGGLTVLEALSKAFPKENFIYLADTARLPYGSKTPETIHAYLKQNIDYLVAQNVKAVVVACNTASTVLLKFNDSFSVPVFNVIEPGARVAMETSKIGHIGVVGTRATILSEAYAKAIHRRDAKVKVTQVACPLWVPLVEEGWLDDPVTSLISYRYLGAILKERPDVLILGCTHYPALRATIEKACGAMITLVDSNIGLIQDLEDAYTAGKITDPIGDQGVVRIVCTDLSPRLKEMVELLLPSRQVEKIEQVDLR